jgi:hypothetical protein
MKGIQIKNLYFGNCHTRIRFMSSGRKILKVYFMHGLSGCTTWWPLASSVTLSTPKEEIQCMLWLAELRSLLAVQRHFRTQYGRQPHIRKSIRFWDKKLRITGSLLHAKSPWKTQTSEENVSRIRMAFERSPHKSIRAATFNSTRCATQKDLPKSVQNSNDSRTETEWSSTTHKLRCGHARKNWRITLFPPPSVLLGRSDVPRQRSCKQVKTAEFQTVKIHMSHVSWREEAPKWTCGPA